MTIQQLKSFLAVCEEMNYTRAAQKCYISRQALRQNISSLEDELCSMLFINTSNRISLTNTGLKLYREALPIVQSFDRLEESMLADIKNKTELSIGVSYALVPDYLPSLSEHLERFALHHRRLELKVFNLNNDDVAPLVLSGKIDCGLVMDLGTSAPGTKRTELSLHKCALLAPSGNRFSSAESINPQELAGEHLCLPGFGAEMQPLCSLEKTESMLAPSYYQAYYFVRENNYCAITRYEDSPESQNKFIRTIPIDGINIHSSIIVSASSENPEAKQLISFLKHEIDKDFS